MTIYEMLGQDHFKEAISKLVRRLSLGERPIRYLVFHVKVEHCMHLYAFKDGNEPDICRPFSIAQAFELEFRNHVIDVQADVSEEYEELRWKMCQEKIQILMIDISEYFGKKWRLKEGGSINMMNQRTCNIIMCCKGHCKIVSPHVDPLIAVAAYMGKECDYPKEDYTYAMLDSIMREALYDYINYADNPGFELRNLLHQCRSLEPQMAERISIMFRLTQVRNDDGYVNGFTEELLKQSEIDLSA